jgi:hypothetical protein
MCRLSGNSGASTSWNPKGLSRPVAGKLYLYLTGPSEAVQYVQVQPAYRGAQIPERHVAVVTKVCAIAPIVGRPLYGILWYSSHA